MRYSNFIMSKGPIALHKFKSDISTLALPQRFTFPFFYSPHPLSEIAARELQAYLETQQDFDHNFGLPTDESPAAPIGKMFGVLVVQQPDGTLGYLASFSGKLAESNDHAYFVPPVFNMLTKNSFFLLAEEEINAINRELKTLEADPTLPALREKLKQMTAAWQAKLKTKRVDMKREKDGRKQQREHAISVMTEQAYEDLIADLIKQSYRDQHEYAMLKESSARAIQELEADIARLQNRIDSLKTSRKQKSAALQLRLFDQYHFLNAENESRSVVSIFAESANMMPPAGAGECAAPKLMQYAYQHQLKPICMAEFWWGASPSSEIRQHKNFYPACKSKCEPILSHMLLGLDVDPNPMLENAAPNAKLEIIYQDEDIIVINKPIELLSVPGINVKDSVYTMILEAFPDISGPVIIHRLDMSTSGILVLAKHKDAHKAMQAQFMEQTVVKRYTALLNGIVAQHEGSIELPLRVDLDDRPRQMVCYEHGKPARTTYKVVEQRGGKTRIHFFPHTGRTHQLRVHAAHISGLHCPILGDDLYGVKADRLHLHAGYIDFAHPRTAERISFEISDPF